MHYLASIVALIAGLSILLQAPRAEACGGCFYATDSESGSQVTGHRMILSLGKTQTTLYDQIEYVGEPSEFAWILPIKAPVEVGLSSDYLFDYLDAATGVAVNVSYTCFGGGGSCNATAASGGGTNGLSSEMDDVQVIAQATVGPYETVQLSSSDGSALLAWMASHGYVIPSDIQPVVDDYVAEGFDFLALRLVPGVGVQAMRPVRVTTQGASPVLPLRMVAAGTGATTTITLFVVSEGRYEPANFNWFVIDESDLVWDFGTESSNYKLLRQQAFDDANGLAWQIESAGAFAQSEVRTPVEGIAANDPDASGYGDGDPQAAIEEAAEDMAVLFAGLHPASVWYTRMRGELSRPAFAKDLQLEASNQQVPVPRELWATQTVGVPPCPPASPGGNCSTSSGGYGADPVDRPISVSPPSDPAGCSGCTLVSRSSGPLAVLLLASLATSLLLRRRRR